MQYRRKPIILSAYRYRVDPPNQIPKWFTEAVGTGVIVTHKTYCHIVTRDGLVVANRGDYIIQGASGEIYPCKAKAFAKIYEPVNGKEDYI